MTLLEIINWDGSSLSAHVDATGCFFFTFVNAFSIPIQTTIIEIEDHVAIADMKPGELPDEFIVIPAPGFTTTESFMVPERTTQVIKTCPILVS